MINKLEYLVRTLSRTKRKDYENYVINRIWNKLDDPDLKPVTQQYVRRKDGYALIDMYFPQLKVGIECDEFHHLYQIGDDELRFQDISRALGDTEYEEIRIPIFDNQNKLLSIENINKSIDAAVERIKSIKKSCNKFIPWTEKTDIEIAKERGVINVEDDYLFSKQEALLFFNTDMKMNLRLNSCFKIGKHDNFIWFPNLAIETNGKIVSSKKAGKGSEYLNIFEEDGSVIYETIKKDTYLKACEEGEEAHNRIVFVSFKDKVTGREVKAFSGVYNRERGVEYKTINGVKVPCAVHRRIANNITSEG